MPRRTESRAPLPTSNPEHSIAGRGIKSLEVDVFLLTFLLDFLVDTGRHSGTCGS